MNGLDGAHWDNPAFGTFDSVPAAALLLFEMSTLEGWTTAMFAGIDAADYEGPAPTRNMMPARSLFFILWIVLGSVLLLNLGECPPRASNLLRPSLCPSPALSGPLRPSL